MRRPLFGNGIPRNILAADGEVTVLDTEELNESTVYALTLFLWNYQPGRGVMGTFTNPSLKVFSRIDGGPAVSVGDYNNFYLESFFKTVNPTRIVPIPLLERYMMRGKQRISLQVTADGGPLPVATIWGYFEQAGDQFVDTPFRGLQPTKLAAPFSYPPVRLVFPPSTGSAEIIHKLDPAYIDLVTLDLSHAGVDDGTSDFGAEVSVPGGLAIPVPSLSIGPGPYRHRIFDGIPMRANDNTDNGSAIYLGGISGPAVIGASFITGYGSFLRI